MHHPVLDDPDLLTWQAYTAKAWPTLVVVDPEGYVVASMSGEGHAHGLTVLIEELIGTHSAKGTLRRGGVPYVPAPAPATALRFPGKTVVLLDGSFLVSDTARQPAGPARGGPRHRASSVRRSGRLSGAARPDGAAPRRGFAGRLCPGSCCPARDRRSSHSQGSFTPPRVRQKILALVVLLGMAVPCIFYSVIMILNSF